MRMINYTAIFLFLALAVSPAQANSGSWARADQVQARLLSSVDSVGTQKTFDMVLEKKLSPGWHTYWRTPGEAGLAPTFDWSGSTNIAQLEVFFPVPKRFDEMGLTTFGYDGETTFPMRVTLAEEGKPAALDLKIDTLVCMEICIPQHLEVSMDIETGRGLISPMAPLVERAWEAVPQKEQNNLKIENIVAGPNGLVVSAYAKDGFDEADVFVELPDYALIAVPRVEPGADETRARLIVAPLAEDEDFLKSLAGQELRVTLTDGRHAVEQIVQY